MPLSPTVATHPTAAQAVHLADGRLRETARGLTGALRPAPWSRVQPPAQGALASLGVAVA